ncbi:DegT/DnrJ/EryC1/StrS family aminotransferase [Turicibacter bilis]|uniref:DegT/DnrJ/EryC1/StrS family aminotransferase n=1 Tax=Turicibacter bilis TaxID=2735723 RepID=UPI0031BA4F3A
MKERIYLASPHMSEEGYEQTYVKEAFETNWVAPLGPNVTNFEQELATYVGVNSASALSSGTAAIHLGLKALGVEAGDVVFCSTLTFSASCNPILYLGATPVFIDSDAKTWNMCPKALKLAFEAAERNNQIPKAVVVVNLYGQSADMDPIIELCEQYQVPILEDAAESLGATYKGRMSGTIGDIGIYSFNGNKIITTSGGGMMISNNEAYTKKATFWATQSREAERHYEHKEIGYNYRMSNIVAGIGRGQLKVLNERIAKKKEIYETYQEAFKDIADIEMMNICDFGQSNYWLSVMTVKETSKVKPLDIMLALEAENIESRPVWKPMHLQPIFKQYPFFTVSENIPVSEDYFNRGVCLPSDTKMTTEQQNHIIELIKQLF